MTGGRVQWVAGAAFLLVAVVLALVAFGVEQVWAVIVGVPLTFAIGLLLAAAAPRVQERTRPQPKLALLVEGDEPVRRVVSNELPPWPIAADRIVANEVADARESLKLEGLVQWQFLQALSQRPSDAARKRGRDLFEKRVVAFEGELREWLVEYERSTAERHASREIRFRVHNAGAHAEAVRLVLELPDTVTIADDVPSIDAPPSRPVYTGRSAAGEVATRPLLDLGRAAPKIRPLERSAWTTNPAGQTLTDIGDVHRDQVVYAATGVVLRASCPGDHTVGWSLLTKSASKTVTGSFVFHVPVVDASRPAFGRMAGILEYPDLVIHEVPASPWREDAEPVDLQPRTADPPLDPPEIPERGPHVKLRDRLIRRRETMDWIGLGLDPEYDGPSSIHVLGPADQQGTSTEK